MSAITPQTDLKLLKCPIESDNRNQLTFANETAQRNYFNSLPKLEVYNFTYQRKDSVIRYPAHIDTILTYNYVMYQNDAYTNKWFYAFITSMEYVNDNMTLITIKTDVYQTWMFDMTWKRSFIEREHTNDDTIGNNTIPEGVELGANKVYYHGSDTANIKYSIVTQSTIHPDSHQDVENVHVYNNIPVPGVLCRFDTSSSVDPLGRLGSFLNWLDENSKKDALINMYLVPEWILGEPQGGSGIDLDPDITYNVASVSLGISRITQLDGYTPKNKKLLTYPYCMIGLSNGLGQFATYKQERWTLDENNEMVIRMRGSICPGASIRAYPIGYNGDGVGIDDSITIGKFPVLGWLSDAYTNWLTQNGVNLGIKGIGAVAGVVGGAVMMATGAGAMAGAGLIASGAGMALDSIKEVYQHSLVPDTVEGSLNSSDVSASLKTTRLHFYRMGITNEYARCIDSYFDMYGYKTNKLKLPNLTGRANWNYVKTIGANIEGDIPEDHLNEIKTLFNTGITLWHNPSTYLDYSQSNAIV